MDIVGFSTNGIGYVHMSFTVTVYIPVFVLLATGKSYLIQHSKIPSDHFLYHPFALEPDSTIYGAFFGIFNIIYHGVLLLKHYTTLHH